MNLFLVSILVTKLTSTSTIFIFLFCLTVGKFLAKLHIDYYAKVIRDFIYNNSDRIIHIGLH